MVLNKLAAAAALIVAASSAHAATISSYDITNANPSGTGGWGHTYEGTITPSSGGLATYSGGSGTLNDGVASETWAMRSTQLFMTADSASITLNFDSLYTLSNITLFSFGGTSNTIPGNMTGFDATIGTTTVTMRTINGAFRSEIADFSGTALAGLETSSLILSNFTSSSRYYAIGEITLSSTPVDVSAVPLPAGAVLLLSGMAGIAGLKRRKTAKAQA